MAYQNNCTAHNARRDTCTDLRACQVAVEQSPMSFITTGRTRRNWTKRTLTCRLVSGSGHPLLGSRGSHLSKAPLLSIGRNFLAPSLICLLRSGHSVRMQKSYCGGSPSARNLFSKQLEEEERQNNISQPKRCWEEGPLELIGPETSQVNTTQVVPDRARFCLFGQIRLQAASCRLRVK